jgi:nucleotide-binding universal stress UspA family protein
MNKILVPTDLSATAEVGLKLAVEIAKRCNASISLVNFTEHPYSSTFTATGDITLKNDPVEDLQAIEMLKNIKMRLEELVVKYATGGFNIEIAVVDNEFKEGIDEYLKAEKIDLIVMGTSGEENAQEVFTGNHTEQAIRISACPVLSVREDFNPQDLKVIVAGVTVITDNQLADALGSVSAIAKCFDAEIHLVHVRENHKSATLVLDEYFNQIAQIAGLSKYQVRILEGDDITTVISQYAEGVNAGLIAVIKNPREGIFRIFSKPVVNKLIKEEGRPVVTVKL